MSACEQLTLVQSDISPIDIASHRIVIKSNFYTVGVSKKRIKKKIKCVHWIHRLSDRDEGYLITKFSAQFTDNAQYIRVCLHFTKIPGEGIILKKIHPFNVLLSIYDCEGIILKNIHPSNFNWPSMQKCQCIIQNRNLILFICGFSTEGTFLHMGIIKFNNT